MRRGGVLRCVTGVPGMVVISARHRRIGWHLEGSRQVVGGSTATPGDVTRNGSDSPGVQAAGTIKRAGRRRLT